VVQGHQPVPQPQLVEQVVQEDAVRNLGMILVNRNDNVDEVVRNAKQQNLRTHNNSNVKREVL